MKTGARVVYAKWNVRHIRLFGHVIPSELQKLDGHKIGMCFSVSQVGNVPGKNVEVGIAVRVIAFDTPRWVDITFSSPRFMTPVPVHIRYVTSTVYNSKRNDSYLTTTRVYSSQYM